MKRLNVEEIFRMSNLFKVFSDETRLKILDVLMNEELPVGDIADQLAMSPSSISHQLKILRDLNLVKTNKIGKNVYYALKDDHIEKIIKLGVEHVNEN